eukprot:scaffold45805_cov16-Tisochrysis_lutea.AAC.1
MVPGPGGMMPRPVGGAAPYARPPAMAPPAGYAGYGAPAPGACVGMHVLGVYVCMGEMYPLQQGFGAPSPSECMFWGWVCVSRVAPYARPSVIAPPAKNAGCGAPAPGAF